MSCGPRVRLPALPGAGHGGGPRRQHARRLREDEEPAKGAPATRLPAQCPSRSSRARRAAPQPTHYTSGDPMVLRGFTGGLVPVALPPGAGVGGTAAQPLLAQPPAPRAPRMGAAGAATQALAARLAAQRQTEVVGGAVEQAAALAQLLASQATQPKSSASLICIRSLAMTRAQLVFHLTTPAPLRRGRRQRDDEHGGSPGGVEQRPAAGRRAGDACRRRASGGPCWCHACACAPRHAVRGQRRRTGWQVY